jgi:hypothetical protein
MSKPDRRRMLLQCEQIGLSTRREQEHRIHIFAGTSLCRLRIWTDSEWMELPSGERPSHHTYVPGLGWVGAVPVCETN